MDHTVCCYTKSSDESYLAHTAGPGCPLIAGPQGNPRKLRVRPVPEQGLSLPRGLRVAFHRAALIRARFDLPAGV